MPSLAGRIMWRMHKDTGIASDSQLVSVEQLEDHVADLSDKELERVNTDVNSFLQYWSYGRKKHSVDEVSHILGIVRIN